MNKIRQWILIIGILWLTAPGIAFGEKPLEISWRTLNGLNYKTGDMTKEVQAIKGKKVKIPGFIVPVEGDDNKVYEFLFVPNKGACVHVPPPPPNLTIHVKMPEKSPAKMEWGPVMLEGIIRIEDNISEINLTGVGNFVESSYEMDGISTESYDAGN
jgi:uncharacterized protein